VEAPRWPQGACEPSKRVKPDTTGNSSRSIGCAYRSLVYAYWPIKSTGKPQGALAFLKPQPEAAAKPNNRVCWWREWLERGANIHVFGYVAVLSLRKRVSGILPPKVGRGWDSRRRARRRASGPPEGKGRTNRPDSERTPDGLLLLSLSLQISGPDDEGG